MAEVPVSANRIGRELPAVAADVVDDPPPDGRNAVEAGRPVAFDRVADLLGPSRLEKSTTASRACHCWRAIVHAPMWNRG